MASEDKLAGPPTSKNACMLAEAKGESLSAETPFEKTPLSWTDIDEPILVERVTDSRESANIPRVTEVQEPTRTVSETVSVEPH